MTLDADQILTNASKPKSATVDGDSASQHSISDQIKAAKFKAEQTAASRSKLPIRIGKFKPPGAV